MIALSHKIEIKPNNKQKTYLRKAFGCARFAYNWGLEEWQRMYKNGEKPTEFKVRKRFNAIKKEQFPFIYDVTNYANDYAFRDLATAFSNFFKGINKYPQFKKKKDNYGSLHIGVTNPVLSDYNKNSKVYAKLHKDQKCQYLIVPKLGCVRMTQHLRFDGKIRSVRVTQNGDKYYAAFFMEITEEEYYKTHPHAKNKKKGKVGIDMGLKATLTLSDGVAIENPRYFAKNERKAKRLQRQLEKRVHARTKQDRLQGIQKSNNYRKLSLKVGRVLRKNGRRRQDFINKVTTILATHYGEIALESLNVDGMLKNHRLAKSISDVSFGEIKINIAYKAALNGVKITKADRWYGSSKTCNQCGHIKEDLTLDDRVYHCPCCGMTMDRDLNAALNLRSLLYKEKIGVGTTPEFTPVDLTALLDRFDKNEIATSKVESGRQQRS